MQAAPREGGKCRQFLGGLPGPQTHLPGRPSLIPGQRQGFPGCCLLHAAPFSFSKGQIRRPQSALGEGLEGWRGPYPGLPPPPIHLGVKHILFPHVWGLRGLPLQDYFLLQFVFQLETLGAPRQGGGSSAVAREASKDPEWNASCGDCWLGRRGSRCGALDGIPHSFSSPPEGLYLWAAGLQRSGMGDSLPPLPTGLRGGQEMPPPS